MKGVRCTVSRGLSHAGRAIQTKEPDSALAGLMASMKSAIVWNKQPAAWDMVIKMGQNLSCHPRNVSHQE